jgi:dTDP-4-amino-4,6-dideoxygalactose transaminase
VNVPFLDLKAQYQGIRREIGAAIQKVLDSCAFAGGPFAQAFEEEFARFCGCSHAVGVGSGTDALWLTLLALGVGPGDEVITVPNTFIATAEAIHFTGAVPVFVDVDEQFHTMDPGLVEAAITEKTKAIIPVHLYGQCADLDPIVEIGRNHRIPVIEDACQAHGAEYKGRKAGTIGRAGCFSFYPGKNLGAYGEAGAIVTDDESLAWELRKLRDHGQNKKYYHDEVGWNARMDGLQAAVLSVKLGYLEQWNDARRQNARFYSEQLQGTARITLPAEAPYAKHIYHIYAVLVDDRDTVLEELKKAGVNCGIHYPVPVHRQDAFGPGSYPAYPVAEKCARQTLSLPMFAELSEEQLGHVVDAIKKLISS